jgi:hypothetical protein
MIVCAFERVQWGYDGHLMTVTSTPRYDHPKLKAVAGDVGALAPLLELKYLSLPDTKVATVYPLYATVYPEPPRHEGGGRRQGPGAAGAAHGPVPRSGPPWGG